MIEVIKITHSGISLNIIVYRRPAHVNCSDSCPAEMGGYNNSGFAWWHCFPPHLQFQATNNLLEHLGGQLKLGNCALSMTNSNHI